MTRWQVLPILLTIILLCDLLGHWRVKGLPNQRVTPRSCRRSSKSCLCFQKQYNRLHRPRLVKCRGTKCERKREFQASTSFIISYKLSSIVRSSEDWARSRNYSRSSLSTVLESVSTLILTHYIFSRGSKSTRWQKSTHRYIEAVRGPQYLAMCSLGARRNWRDMTMQMCRAEYSESRRYHEKIWYNLDIS